MFQFATLPPRHIAMTFRSSRLLKKLHRRWIGICLIDAGQNLHWRQHLFDSGEGEVFELSAERTFGLHTETTAAVRRYKLRFSVRKADVSEAEAWLSEGGSIILKFWATAYPTVTACSGNATTRHGQLTGNKKPALL